jgi:hypothetical protein
MELKQILKNKDSIMEISKQEGSEDPRTHTVKQGKIKRARQDLVDMYNTYRQNVYQKSIVILSLGEEAESFNEIAEKEYGCYKVNGMGLFEDIADRIDKAHYTNHTVTANLFDMITDMFQESADEIGIISYPMMVFNKKYHKRLNGKQDLVNLLADVFFENVGPEVVGHYAVTKASKMAFEDDFIGKVVPVVLSIREDLAKELEKSLELIGMKVFVVLSDKQADKEEVGKKLVSIKKKLK